MVAGHPAQGARYKAHGTRQEADIVALRLVPCAVF
jgi:hypothetical protein